MNAQQEKMLIISSISPKTRLAFSQYTQQWYVDADIEIGNGVILSGPTQHRDTPEEAIDAYFDFITDLEPGEYLATRYLGRRREWGWNGAAFIECTRESVLAQREKGAAA